MLPKSYQRFFYIVPLLIWAKSKIIKNYYTTIIFNLQQLAMEHEYFQLNEDEYDLQDDIKQHHPIMLMQDHQAKSFLIWFPMSCKKK